jgi:hypothetical protein
MTIVNGGSESVEHVGLKVDGDGTMPECREAVGKPAIARSEVEEGQWPRCV